MTAFVQRLAPVPERGRHARRQRRRGLPAPGARARAGPRRRHQALARLLIDRGDAAEALALLQRLPETEASRALAAEARLLEAGVDVSGDGRGDRGQARRAARAGAGRRRRPPGVRGPARDDGRRRSADQRVPAGPGRAPVLMAAPATRTPGADDDRTPPPGPTAAYASGYRARPRSTSAAAATT